MSMLVKPNIRKALFMTALISVNVKINAQIGKNGNYSVSGTNIEINARTNLTTNASVGTTTLRVGNSALNGGAITTSLASGDLILIIQMQGASINTSNSSSYGNITNYNSSGLYEIKCVQSVPNSTTINIGTPLQNSYTTGGNSQIVRIPRFTRFTIPASQSIRPSTWNGVTGGVTIIETRDSMIINGSINADGTGFRGGLSDNTTQAASAFVTSYFSNDVADGGRKGESIAGSETTYDNLGGRYGRGAPANGGGGGNSHNAGGGGGANAGIVANYTGFGNPNNSTTDWTTCWNLESTSFANHTSSGGGRGGYSYAHTNRDARNEGPGDTRWTGNRRENLGGFGGRPLNYSGSRIFMGGGGGAGDGNNNAANGGANGGGIVIIISHGVVIGSGTISSKGATADNTLANHNDAPGGGGGGGAILISSTNSLSSSLNLNVSGGNGGNQLITNAESEGPGGGGGGGYIAVSGGSPTIVRAGGVNGTTSSNALTEFIHNGATCGGVGTYISNFNIQNIINPINISAGPDETFCNSLFLNASPLVNGNIGTWSILSGSGGSFININSPTTQFIGNPLVVYELEWRVSNNLCESKTDTVRLTPDCSLLTGDWLSFVARKSENSNLLFWELTSDDGIDKFTIYRSKDGKTFEEIGIQTNTHLYGDALYDFEDNNPPRNTTCYYRIKRSFNGGKYDSSEIVRVDASQEAKTYKVYPNPAQSEINIKGTYSSQKITGWKVLGMDGHEVLRSENDINVAEVKLDLNKMAHGNYIVMIQNSSGKNSTIKFNKN